MQRESTEQRRHVRSNGQLRHREHASHAPRITELQGKLHKPQHQTSKTPLAVIGPLKVILFTIWSFSLVNSLALDIIADLFQDNAPKFPLEPVTVMSIGLSVFSALLTMVIGCGSKKRFLFFQPFVGGQAFVIMQMIGYTIASVSCSLKVMLVHETYHSHRSRYGALSVLGCFTATAELILMASLQFFIPPPKVIAFTAQLQTVSSSPLTPPVQPEEEKQQEKQQHLLNKTVSSHNAQKSIEPSNTQSPATSLIQSWIANLSLSPTREFVFITILLVTLTLTSSIAEYYPAFREVNVAIIVTFVAACMGVIHFVVSRKYMYKYCFFDPFTLPWRYALVQMSGNVLLFSSLCGDVVLFVTSAHSPPSWHIGSCLVAVTGVCAHLLLIRLIGLHTFNTTVENTINNNNNNNETTTIVNKQSEVTLNENVDNKEVYTSVFTGSVNTLTYNNNNNNHNMSDAIRYNSNNNSNRNDMTLTRHMPLLATLVSVMMGAAVYIITFILSSSSFQFVLSDDITIGLRQVEQLLATLMFVLPPFTHMQGHFLFGGAYEIWSPFNGSTEFIILQGAGWAGFGFAIFFATLNATETEHFNFMLLHTTYLLLSQLFIHVSLHIFDQELMARSTLASNVEATTTTTTTKGVMSFTSSSSEEALLSSKDTPIFQDNVPNTNHAELACHELAEESISSVNSSSNASLLPISPSPDNLTGESAAETTQTASASSSLSLPIFSGKYQHEHEHEHEREQVQVKESMICNEVHSTTTTISSTSPLLSSLSLSSSHTPESLTLTPNQYHLSSSSFSSSSSSSESSLVSVVVNGELLLSLILATVAMVLYGICDGMAYNNLTELYF